LYGARQQVEQALQDSSCEECGNFLDEAAIKEFQDGQPDAGLPRFCSACSDRMEVEFLEARANQ
ncbi:MAG: hypothetical protein ACYDHY_06795, partial [Acidiferrobacterales bacterium]